MHLKFVFVIRLTNSKQMDKTNNKFVKIRVEIKFLQYQKKSRDGKESKIKDWDSSCNE